MQHEVGPGHPQNPSANQSATNALLSDFGDEFESIIPDLSSPKDLSAFLSKLRSDKVSQLFRDAVCARSYRRPGRSLLFARQ